MLLILNSFANEFWICFELCSRKKTALMIEPAVSFKLPSALLQYI